MNEVDEVKQRLDVVDVVGGYIQLKPAGRNFKGLSPFKQEKTPSFMVSPEKGIWHDFSSGQGGDIFTFVQLMEGVDFREALEILARRAGVELKPRHGHGDTKDNKSRLYSAVDMAIDYYHATLAKNKPALHYLLKERGLSSATIKKYKLGYGPDSWEALSGFLMKKGFKSEELLASGLASRKPGAKTVYDIFRGRVIFPIYDTQGRAIGMSARVLDANAKAAKYINTPQTPIYNKSSAIFGLVQAKEAIRGSDEVIVVEGNMDVIGLANAGICNVVAVSGTALTEQQLKVISRLTKNIKLAFDSDEAGLAATIRAIELAGVLEVRLSIIEYGKSGAKDPDELVKKDKAAWDLAVESAKYALDYLFDLSEVHYDLSTATGKRAASDFLLPIIKTLHDEIERDHYIKRLAKRLIVSEDSIRAKLGRVSSASFQSKNVALPVKAPSAEPTPPAAAPPSKKITIENQLLEVLLAFPYTREAVADIKLDDVTDQNQAIFAALKKNPKANLDMIAKTLKEKGNDVKILSLRGEEEYSSVDEHDIRLEAYTQVHRLQKYNRELNKRRLARQIAEAEAAGKKSEAVSLLDAYQALIQEE